MRAFDDVRRLNAALLKTQVAGYHIVGNRATELLFKHMAACGHSASLSHEARITCVLVGGHNDAWLIEFRHGKTPHSDTAATSRERKNSIENGRSQSHCTTIRAVCHVESGKPPNTSALVRRNTST